MIENRDKPKTKKNMEFLLDYADLNLLLHIYTMKKKN